MGTPTTVQKAFDEYETKIRVPAAQVDRAKEVHPDIRATVKEQLGDQFNRAFLAGSYARKVQIAPVLKDVDVVFVLNDTDGSFAESANVALEALREAAKSSELVERTRLGVRAVKLTMKDEEFTVDAVAALEDPSGALKLARYVDDYDDWTPADPKGQTDAHWEKNKTTGGKFIPTVRIVKSWNQRNKWKTKNLLPSYLAEAILFGAIDQEVEYADAVVAFFKAAESHLGSSSPSVPCPGSPDNYVDERLDDERRKNALSRVQSALETAEAAIAADADGDVDEAQELWGKLFGPSFPVPSADTKALAEGLRSGTARVTSAGIHPTRGERQPIQSRPWRAE